jgi:hypothetical protein
MEVLGHPSQQCPTQAHNFSAKCFLPRRFSAKRKSHGWCDFAQSSVVLDGSTGFAVNDTILVTADILVLSEQTQFVRENELVSASSNASAEVLSGKFTWKVCAIVYPLLG